MMTLSHALAFQLEPPSFRSSLPLTSRALAARPRLEAVLEAIVATRAPAFDNPVDYLVGVSCPELLPSMKAFYDHAGPDLVEVLRLPRKVRRLDHALHALVDGLAFALAGHDPQKHGQPEDLVAAVLAALGLDPAPALETKPPRAGRQTLADTRRAMERD